MASRDVWDRFSLESTCVPGDLKSRRDAVSPTLNDKAARESRLDMRGRNMNLPAVLQDLG